MPGLAVSQQSRRRPWSLRLGFIGWWGLLVLMSWTGFVLDFWEGDGLVYAARWLEHIGFFGASIVGWGRYLSLSRKQPLEGMVEAIMGLDKSVLTLEAKGTRRKSSGFLYHSSLILAMVGLGVCTLSLQERIRFLPLVDGLWLINALIWLIISYRHRISGKKEQLKEMLDDLRSKRRSVDNSNLQLTQQSHSLAFGTTLFGLVLIAWASGWRILTLDNSLNKAELKICLKAVLEEVDRNGDLRKSLPEKCDEDIQKRFRITGSGVGESRLIQAQELEGLDPLGDGIKGNQRLGLRANGLFIQSK